MTTDCTCLNLFTHCIECLPKWTYVLLVSFYLFILGCFHRTLQRVRLANRGRKLLRSPGPVPLGTCICSNVDAIISWAFHVFGLWILNIPRYFYFAYDSFFVFDKHVCLVFHYTADWISPSSFSLRLLQSLDLSSVQTAGSIAYFNEFHYIFLIYHYTTIYVCVQHFYELFALVCCWSSVSIRRTIYKCLNVCPFDNTAFVVSGKDGYT